MKPREMIMGLGGYEEPTQTSTDNEQVLKLGGKYFEKNKSGVNKR